MDRLLKVFEKILKLLLTCCRKYEDNNLYAQITLLEFVTFLEKISQFYWRLGRSGDLLTSSILRFLVKHVLSWHPDTETERGWRKENDNIHLFPYDNSPVMTQRLLTLIFIIFSCLFTFCYYKFLLPTGIGSCSNFPCILFWDSACLGFIARVRCVEWANCYFWVIIAAMFVCQDRYDLCLVRSPALQWFSFALSPRSKSAIFSFHRRKDVTTIPSLAPPLTLVCDDVWSQWVIGTTCYGMRVATL